MFFLGAFIPVPSFLVKVITSIVSGLALATMFYFIVPLVHSKKIKRHPFVAIPTGTSKIHHIVRFEADGTWEEVFSLCSNSLEVLNRAKTLQADSDKGIIEAETGMTWKTFGDLVTFDLLKITDEIVKVEFSSRPIVSTTLLDYGENAGNVKGIMRFMINHGNIRILESSVRL
jgi:hypothetical protein